MTFLAVDGIGRIPLLILDWDIAQIEGALLEAWLPGVFGTLDCAAGRSRAPVAASTRASSEEASLARPIAPDQSPVSLTLDHREPYFCDHASEAFSRRKRSQPHHGGRLASAIASSRCTNASKAVIACTILVWSPHEGTRLRRSNFSSGS